MLIHDMSVASQGATATLTALVRPDRASESRSLWYRFDGLSAPLEHPADALAVTALPFCMFEGEPCRIEAPLSPTLRANLAKAQTTLAEWYDFLTPVAIESTAPDGGAAPRSDGVASCFSGGVDSWFSLLAHGDRISHLLLVRGFDVGLANDPLWTSVQADAAGVAALLGKSLITCETNLRSVFDKGRAGWGRPFQGDFWGRCLHGAALASVAVGLGRTIGEVIVPATHVWNQLRPWGSSPMLDPYWSNGAVTIVHDACDADRVAKVAGIAASDLALATLRVCHNDVGQTNCGRCEKCLRTMLALRLCGALERATRFPGAEGLARLKRLEVSPHLLHHYETLLEAARRQNDDEVAHLAEIVLRRRFSAERTLALAVRRVQRTLRDGSRNIGRGIRPVGGIVPQEATDGGIGRH